MEAVSADIAPQSWHLPWYLSSPMRIEQRRQPRGNSMDSHSSKKNTTFFSDFGEFRKQWFAVEDRISGIKDEYAPFDWKETRDKAKDVVARHQALMVKFARDCQAAKGKLSTAEAAHAEPAIDSCSNILMPSDWWPVVLKLYEIAEKLYGKTLDPYSYTMETYNTDFRKFRELNYAFEKKGKEVNLLFYGENSPPGR